MQKVTLGRIIHVWAETSAEDIDHEWAAAVVTGVDAHEFEVYIFPRWGDEGFVWVFKEENAIEGDIAPSDGSWRWPPRS